MTNYVGYTQADPASGENANNAYKARATHAGSLLKSQASPLLSRGGILPPFASAMLVTAAGAMTLSVAPGQAVIPAAGVGAYTVTRDAAETVTVTAAGASARYDLVVLRVYDTEQGDPAPPSARVEVVKGTTLADPAIPARSIVLARVTVGASVSSISSANVADLRVFTAAAGGVVPVANLTAAAGLPIGTPVYDVAAERPGFVRASGPVAWAMGIRNEVSSAGSSGASCPVGSQLLVTTLVIPGVNPGALLQADVMVTLNGNNATSAGNVIITLGGASRTIRYHTHGVAGLMWPGGSVYAQAPSAGGNQTAAVYVNVDASSGAVVQIWEVNLVIREFR